MKKSSHCEKRQPDEGLGHEFNQNTLEHSEKRAITGLRLLSVVGFAILAGLSGFGLTWLVFGIITANRFKSVVEALDHAGKSMPILVAGGIIGFTVGLIVSIKVAKADPKKEEEIVRKYVGYRGGVRIYFGAPVFVIGLAAPFFERLLNRLGTETGTYVALGAALAVIAASLFLYDRIPAKYIIPIGIIGWLLTLSMVVWFAFLRPGAF